MLEIFPGFDLLDWLLPIILFGKILSTDLKQFLSGGAGNSNPNLSFGGIISSTAVVDNTDNNLFADVDGTEAAAGSTKYRGIYYKNDHASLELINARIFIATQTTSTDDSVEIGKDPAGAGDGSTTGVMTTIANENTAPAGVTFSTPASYVAGISLSGMTFGKVHGVWHKRIVNAGALAFDANQYQNTLQGETTA